MKPHIRILGDVHANVPAYLNLIKKAQYSVQLGDFGFGAEFHQKTAQIDKSRHVVILGNHDDYSNPIHMALGDFGEYSLGGFNFFYIRGAYSIDRACRTLGIDWWAQEELTWSQGYKCIEAYRKAKPSIVLTHDCPEEIIYLMGRGYPSTITRQILQTCLEVHRPKMWIFGHHHINWTKTYKDTTFRCLDGDTCGHTIGFCDFDKMGNLIN
jgi:hypothetical protein